MSTRLPRVGPLQSAGAAVHRGLPGMQLGRRAGLAPVRRDPDHARSVIGFAWVQLPDYTITLEFAATNGWTSNLDPPPGAQPHWLPGQITDPVIALQVGENFETPATFDASAEDLAYQWLQIINFAAEFSEEVWISATGSVVPRYASGDDLTSLSLGQSQGTWVPPTDPPGPDYIEWENVRGRIVGDLTIDSDGAYAELTYQVGSTGGTDPAPGGTLHWSNLGPADHRPQDELDDGTLLASWPEQTPTPLSVTVSAADVFGATEQQDQTMWLWVLTNALSQPGTGSRPDADGHLFYTAAVNLPTITATIRPPRYRVVEVPASGWLASPDWSGYVWDAGLYLGADFSALTGYPTAPLPSGAAMLVYYVVPDSGDFFSNDYQTPNRSVFRDQFGGTGSSTNPPGSTPDAGSHLWVVWFGPTFSLADPEPSVTPGSTVPAVLAQNGTG